MVREGLAMRGFPRVARDNPPVTGLRRDWGVLSQFRLPLGLLAFSMIYGVVGFIVAFGASFIDALYMTAITLTTVGYREVVPVESAGAKLFTISLLAVGLGAVFSGIGVLGNLIGSGELSNVVRRRTVRKRVEGLANHFIVCAYGRVGRSVVEELRRNDVPVMVLDTDPGLERRLQDDGVPYTISDPSEEGVLRTVGVERARGLVCAVDSDEINVYITLTARALNPKLTIVARASRSQSIRALEQAGADQVISPYRLSGRRMANLSLRPGLVDFIEMVTVGPDLRLDEIVVPEGSALVGTTVDACTATHTGVTILAHKTRAAGRLETRPRGDTVLGAGDLVVAFGPRDALEAMEA
jgi:voltage-gated potassium channel